LVRESAELGALLRHWRERLTPEEVGLTSGPGRRVTGLRRPEVARLAGVSADYLVQLEQDLAADNVVCPALPETLDGRTIGELLANATGPERHAVRETLLGVDAILPDNNARARFGSANLKDVAGYDTKRLYIGSHGNFGAITTLIFKIAVRT
jgi:glycolate oxidase